MSWMRKIVIVTCKQEVHTGWHHTKYMRKCIAELEEGRKNETEDDGKKLKFYFVIL